MNADSLLHRQVNPAWIQEGRITSQVFCPTPKDEKQLSVYDGNLTTAEKAWTHFTQRLELRSVGVVAVNVKECEDHQLSVMADPETFPEHVLINFSTIPENRFKSKAKYLKTIAESRGWQFQAKSSS